MNDDEIQSLLEEAGYQYTPATGRYMFLDASGEQDEDFATEDVADQLEIPVEDLLRWEQERQE